MPFQPSTKRFDMLRDEENLYNKPLPEILTCLVLDYGEFIPDSLGKKIRSLPIGEYYEDKHYAIKRVA